MTPAVVPLTHNVTLVSNVLAGELNTHMSQLNSHTGKMSVHTSELNTYMSELNAHNLLLVVVILL